jgi:hypothetical protein
MFSLILEFFIIIYNWLNYKYIILKKSLLLKPINQNKNLFDMGIEIEDIDSYMWNKVTHLILIYVGW